FLVKRSFHRSPPSSTYMRADSFFYPSLSFFFLDQRGDARKNLHEAITIDPCHPEAVFNDSLLSWRAGEMTDRAALERLRQAISMHDGWEAKLLEAWMHIERGDEKNAWLVLDRVAELASGAVRGTRAVSRASRVVRDAIREIKSFKACPGIADALAVSHDERRVIVGGRDGSVRIFDLATGHQEQRYAAHGEYVFGVALTRDGRRVYSAGWDGTFTAHDLETGKRVFQKKQPGKLSVLVLSPDAKRAWTGSLSGTLRAWSMTKRSVKELGNVVDLPHDMSIMCAALTPDGTTLFAGGEDNVLYWIDPQTGASRQSLKLSSRPYSLAFTRENGRDVLLIGRGDQHVSLHDPATGEEIGALRDLQSSVSEIAVSRNGQWAVCSNGLTWTLWDLPARRCVRTFEAPALITGALFLANGELVTLDWNGFVRRYVVEAPALAPMMVALPRRARELAAGRIEVDNALRESEAALDAGHVEEALALARRAREIKGFERAPDVLDVWERIANHATRSGVRTVWPVDRWGPIKASSGITVDPSRTRLAAANDKGVVTIWSIGTNEAPIKQNEFSFHSDELNSRTLSFSADGKRLVVGTYKCLHVFDLETGAKQTTTEPRGYVRNAIFGVDDALVAALDDHGHAHVFRGDGLERLATVRGPENWVNALAFADDDHLLVGDYDGHLLLWNITRAAESGFTPGEWNSDDKRQPAPTTALVRNFNKYAVAGQQSISAVQVRNGRIYYGCADKGLHVLDLQTGRRLFALTGHGSTVSCFDFLDEQHIVTGSFDKLVRIFDLRSQKNLAIVEGHSHTVWDVAAIGAGRFLTASDDEQIRRFHVDWELEAKK
ncbi:MAG TPA: PQQ-binding-like beta-propeller repeat protein, partial [Polyangium sp.]|nr:PQQ-binding-like beta-propeller repeat protein [Polyangium sp.]